MKIALQQKIKNNKQSFWSGFLHLKQKNREYWKVNINFKQNIHRV